MLNPPFKESLSVILISVLFIILAARIEVASFVKMGYGGLIMLFVAICVARPLSVWLSAMGSKVAYQERWMVSWIAPRGIVAAAVSSLFVLRLESHDLPGTDLLVPLVFTLIIGAVLIQSIGATPIANYLGVKEPKPNGVMISGGNDVALELGKSLNENGFSVLIANSDYEEIKKARMAGLATCYGIPVSEHAERHLQLIGIGSLFTMSVRSEANLLAVLKYRHEFGHENTYRLKNKESKNMGAKDKMREHWQTSWLFGENITFSMLNGLLAKGATIKTTNITNDYTFDAYQKEKIDNAQQYIPLYAITPNGELKVFCSHRVPKCDSGWKVVALILEAQ